MNLNETAAFVAVVTQGSFTGAAKSLGLPKSTVSRQIKRLEERLGVQLLHRTTRRHHLTEAGTTYFERCRPALERVSEAESLLEELSSEPRGVLRVASPSGDGRMWRWLDLTGFLRRYPEVELEIFAGQRSVDMIAEGIDVALRGGALKDSTTVARSLMESALFFAASPTYLQQHGTPHTLADLAGHRQLVFRPGPKVMSTAFAGPNGTEHWTPRPTVAANDFSVLIDLAAQGQGIATCELAQTYDLLQSGDLVPVLPDYAATGSGFWVVRPAGKLVAPKTRVFIDHVVDATERTLRPMMAGFRALATEARLPHPTPDDGGES